MSLVVTMVTIVAMRAPSAEEESFEALYALHPPSQHNPYLALLGMESTKIGSADIMVIAVDPYL